MNIRYKNIMKAFYRLMKSANITAEDIDDCIFTGDEKAMWFRNLFNGISQIKTPHDNCRYCANLNSCLDKFDFNSNECRDFLWE